MLTRERGFACVILSAAIWCACGGSSNSTQNTNPLPTNPADWVCRDAEPSPQDIQEWCSTNPDRGMSADLGTPPPLAQLDAKNAYDQKVLQPFLRDQQYVALGWKHDMNWRFTGPYVGMIGSGQSYGVHPAVRIYYSPEIIDWLCSGRTGAIPDGAVIVKEMHTIEPCLDVVLDHDGCMAIEADPVPGSWTMMIRASTTSQDGWYWAGINQPPPDPPTFEWQVGNPPVFDPSAITSDTFFGDSPQPTAPNPLWYPTGYVFENADKLPDTVAPFSEYGTDCINCHASAAAQSTFTALDNLLGPGIRYKGFDFAPGSCGTMNAIEQAAGSVAAPAAAALIYRPDGVADAYQSPFTPALPAPAPGFADFFNQTDLVTFSQAWDQRFPAETYDHVPSSAPGPQEFVTSDQCATCHDATVSNSSTPNMVFKDTSTGTSQLLNLSPYGEWKASPMGLAGRDPIFFAQLQSETNIAPAMATCIENTCLHCHGVMGQRQLAIDTAGQDDAGCTQIFGIAPPPEVPFGTPFRREMVAEWPGSTSPAHQTYGALARDGISCAVCHHAADQDLGEERTYTGNFVTGPANEMYGPYETDAIIPKPMEHAIGVTPKRGKQMLDSDQCAGCHNILLPVFDNGGTLVGHSYEQATHLEWVNSDFAPGRDQFLSCQDCHMPTSFNGKDLHFKIANIESSDFAPTTERLADDDIELSTVDRYPRHSLHGINVFLNEMFQQFPLILGYRQISYQTGTLTVPPLITGLGSILDMAENRSAAVQVTDVTKTADGKLSARIKVTNKVGHFFPSGVGFRRIFVEFLVLDADGNVLWASGRTNDLGAILDGRTNQVLPSEQPVPDGSHQCTADASVPFQPHYQIVQREDQAQIFEELTTDSDGVLTTSFLRRVHIVKDNRLRPRGFDPAVFAKSPSVFIQELAGLHGTEQFDPHYTDPSLTGTAEIQYLATLDDGALSKVDHVQVTLYSQSIPPPYLQQRFHDSNCGAQQTDDIQRLNYVTSHLNVQDVMDGQQQRALEQWKLRIASAAKRLG